MATIDDHPRKVAVGTGLAGAALALAVATVGTFEGKRNYTYFDIVGVPTSCYGHTGADVHEGQHFTNEECNSQLAADLDRHYQGIVKCQPMIDVLPEKTKVAFLSLAFNIGVGAFCRSSIPARIKADQLPQACATISLFNRAGGKPNKGLTLRRTAERKLCEAGLK